MKKQKIEKLIINNETIELPFPIEIIPYHDDSGTIGSAQHAYTVLMAQVVVQLIKGFMERQNKDGSE